MRRNLLNANTYVQPEPIPLTILLYCTSICMIIQGQPILIPIAILKVPYNYFYGKATRRNNKDSDQMNYFIIKNTSKYNANTYC